MKPFTRDDLRQLAADHPGWCVTIHLPTHRTGEAARQDRIRLKNLLGESASRLTAVGLRAPAAKALLDPAERLITDGLFWRHQADGLVVFLAEGFFRSYRVPLSLTPLAVVARRFHLAPLLPLFTGDGRFFVLALSENAVRVLDGTRHSIDVLEVDGLPRSLADALPFDDPERQVQFHTGAPQAKGERAAVFHGHGVGGEVEKDRLLRYFRKVDTALHDLLRNEAAPLVLAAVDYLHGIYDEANTYPQLVSGRILGNPEALAPADLHRRAWGVVEPLFLGALNGAVAAYARLAGTGRTSIDVVEIVAAVRGGRVETLFVAGGSVWGRVDAVTGQARLSPERGPEDEDLIDHAAIRSLQNGATVFALDPARMPVDAPLAAVFRY